MNTKMNKRADEQRYVSGLNAHSRMARQIAAKTKEISGPGRKRQGGARSRYDAQTGKIKG